MLYSKFHQHQHHVKSFIMMHSLRPQYVYEGDTDTPKSGAATGQGWSPAWTFRILSIIANAVIVGISVYYSQNWTIGPLIMIGPPAILALVWDLTHAICSCASRRYRTMSLVNGLVLDVLLFLALAGMTAYIAFVLAVLPDSGYYVAYFQGEAGSDVLRAILGTGVVSSVFRLVLLVLVGVEIRRRSRAASAAKRQSQLEAGANAEAQRAPMLSAHGDEPPPAYSPALVGKEPDKSTSAARAEATPLEER